MAWQKMILISLSEPPVLNKNQKVFWNITAKGHASKHICIATSTLLQTLVLSLHKLELSVSLQKQKGFLQFSWMQANTKQQQLKMEGILLFFLSGIHNLSKQHPEDINLRNNKKN